MAITVSLPSTVTPLGRAPGEAEPFTTFSPITADYIDPTTQEYLSLTKGMDPIDAQVLIAIKTIKGSGAAVLEDGSGLRNIRKITRDVVQRVQAEVRSALRRLVANRDIRIDQIPVTVLKGSQQVDLRIDYFNLRAREPGRTSIKAVITS
jgi:hypothetical protein